MTENFNDVCANCQCDKPRDKFLCCPVCREKWRKYKPSKRQIELDNIKTIRTSLYIALQECMYKAESHLRSWDDKAGYMGDIKLICEKALRNADILNNGDRK